MWDKKTKIAYAMVVILLVGIGAKSYINAKEGSIILQGNNSIGYYDLYGNNNVKLLNNLTLVTYDEDYKKSNKYKLDFNEIIESEYYDIVEDCNKWILINDIDHKNIVGVNTQNGGVENLANNLTNGEDPYSIRDFSIEDENLIYAYVTKATIKVYLKNINTDEVTEIGDFDNIDETYVSIYGDNVAYLNAGKIYVYNISLKKFIMETSGEQEYSGDILIYNDKIYTYKNSGYGLTLVELDNNLKEKNIMNNINSATKIYADNNRIIFGNYFYNIKEDQLYKRNAEVFTGQKIIIGDYILNEDYKYEKMKLDYNYLKVENQ